MKRIEVSTQAELDKALSKTNNGAEAHVVIVAGEVCDVRDGAYVHAVSGSGRVGSVYDSGRVGSVSDSGRVGSVYDSGRVGSVSGSGQVGSVSGSGRVGSVSGSSTVHVHSKNAKVTAADTPVIWLHVDDAPGVFGGRQLRAPEPEPMTVDRALRVWGIEPVDGKVRLFKAVDDDLKSERGFAYPLGETVVCDDWHDRPECGGGLHFSPDPILALRYFAGATRFVAVDVAVEDIAMCSASDEFPDKCKARVAYCAVEVDDRGEVLAGSGVAS